MHRRSFLAGIASLVAMPRAAEAQPVGKVWRIGMLSVSLATRPVIMAAFADGMRDRGYVEGRDYIIERRSSAVGGSEHHHQPNDRNAIKPYALRGPFGLARWAVARGRSLSDVLTIDIRGQRACWHHRVLATQEEEGGGDDDENSDHRAGRFHVERSSLPRFEDARSDRPACHTFVCFRRTVIFSCATHASSLFVPGSPGRWMTRRDCFCQR